jgi:hypothetical protein
MTILLASLAFGAILADVALLVTDVALLGPGLGSNTCAFDLLTSGIVVVLRWLVAMDAFGTDEGGKDELQASQMVVFEILGLGQVHLLMDVQSSL